MALESVDRVALARRYAFEGTPSAEDFGDKVRYLLNDVGFDSPAEAFDVAWTAVGDCGAIDIGNIVLWRRWMGHTALVWGAERGDLTRERLRAIGTRIINTGATMQYRHMDAVFEHSRSTGNARLVLLAIAKSADEADEMYRGARSLAEMCGLSVRTVERALKELRELGEIEPIGPATEISRADRRPVKYRIVLPSGGPSDRHPVKSNGPTTCHPADGNGPSDCQERPDNLSPTARQNGGQRDQRKDQRKRPAGELFDTLAEACGIDLASLTPSARGRLNKACGELRAVTATPDDVRARAAQYRRKWPKVDLTPTALAAHWHELTPPKRTPAWARSPWR